MLYYIILAFGNVLDHMIWIRNDVIISEIKCPIIGTVFLPSIIFTIYPFY